LLFLYIFLKILLKLLLALLAAIAIFLLIPFFYEIRIMVSSKWSCFFKIEWGKAIGIKGDIKSDNIKDINIIFFNKIVQLPSGFKTKRCKKAELKQKEIEESGKGVKKSKSPLKTKFENIKLVDKELIILLLKYIKKVLIILKPEVVNFDIKYGFDDPFVTGISSGFIYSFVYPFQNSIDIEPCFDVEVFAIDGEVIGIISVGKIFIETLLFLLNKHIIKKLISFKKSETFN